MKAAHCSRLPCCEEAPGKTPHATVTGFLVRGQKVLDLIRERIQGWTQETSKSRFINGSKVKPEQKCILQMGEWAGSRRSAVLKVLRPQAFTGVWGYGGGQSYKTGLMCYQLQRLGFVFLISEDCVMYHQFCPHARSDSS
jgi:hypothetical protein